MNLKKLKDICEIKPPKKESKQKLSDNDLVSFVPMNSLNIVSKHLNLEQEKPLKDVYKGYVYFADNDVLLAKITPCFENGKLGIARNLKNGVGFGSSEYIVFRSKGKIDPDYLFYFLSQNSFRQEGSCVMSGAVGHKRVPKDFIEDYLIPVPPLEEQKRIVKILDKVFEGIDRAEANTKKNLANAIELFDSYLNQVFLDKDGKWISDELENIVGSVSTGPFGSLLHKSDYIEDGIPLVNPANIDGNQIIPNRKKTVSVETLKRLQNYALSENDVVVGRRGEMGRCAVIEKSQEGWLCGTGCFFVRPKEDINSIFIAHLLRSTKYKEKLESLATGATMKNLSNSALAKLLIALPSFSEQQKIVDSLSELHEKTEQLKFVYQRKLEALAELKQSILQKAFTGKLTT